jgi:tetratricopeptide (TPR) repeat protein
MGKKNKKLNNVKQIGNKISQPVSKKNIGNNLNIPTISVCMIVKNEEKFLDKCLASVKDYADELIIVDTGSTDSTVEIAKRYTDKIYFHPWENSFSKARNQALSYAKCDWVFQIDGDEELMEGSGDRLRKAVQEANNEDVIFVKLLCSYANGTKTSMHNFERLFRNNGIIHYEGRVHNRVVGYYNPRYSNIELWHYGYIVEEEKAQEKFERTKGLLLKDIEEDPNNPLPHHYLSTAFLSRGMFIEALEEAKLAIQLADSTDNRHHIYGGTYFNASMSLFKLGENDKAKEYSLRALDIYPGHMDSYYMLTIIAGEKSEWNDVCKYGTRFIEIWKTYNANPEKSGMMLNNTISEAHTVYVLFGHAYHSENSFNKMNQYYNEAINITDNKWLTLWNIGTYHLDKTSDMEKAGHYLKRAVQEAPQEHNAWYMLAKYNNKYGFDKDEIAALEKVVEIGTKDNFILNRLLTLFIKNGHNDKAMTLLKSIKNPDIFFYSTLLTLGNLSVEKGDFVSAIECYMKATQIKPDSHEAWGILAEISLSIGQVNDSSVFIEKAISIKENDISYLLIACYLKLKIGDIESHIKYCDRILSSLHFGRNRTISNFNDIKNLYIEMSNSPNIGAGNISRIKEIINELERYISHATA